MKSEQINYLGTLNSMLTMKDAANLISASCSYHAIDVLNWPSSFGYKPDTEFAIARSDDSLFIHFRVEEDNIKALYVNDQDPVWQDSCVEFFCRLPEQSFYYNFEINCIGTCLATARDGRDENVRPFTSDQLKQIERHASLGNKPLGEKNEKTAWSVCVKIPFALLGLNGDNLPEKLHANFYKCGDETAIPHYVSWNPIDTATPNFHCPEFFGEIRFK